MRPLKSTVQSFLASKGIAIYGFSSDKNKFGNMVYNELSKKGYPVFAMHPSEKELHGVACYQQISDISEPIDAAFINVDKTKVLPILEQLHSEGISKVWIQQMAESDEALAFCAEHQLQVISKECILMFAEPVAFPHKIHGF